MTTEVFPAANGEPTLRVTDSRGRAMLVHSGRNPSAEARAWAGSESWDGDAFVLFGFGLGYQAAEFLARVPAAAPLFVVEPVLSAAECRAAAPAVFAALASRGAEFGADWPAVRAWAGRVRPAWDRLRLLVVPSYQRRCPDAHGRIDLHLRALRDTPVAPAACPELFAHHPGVSVVVSTYDRPARAASLVAALQRQRGVRGPVEVLVVNDNGTRDVFDAVAALQHVGAGAVRTFDTRYPGYGVALARNIGFRFARYDTVVCLDDDVEVGEDLVASYQAAPEGLRLGRVDCPVVVRGETRLADPRGALMQGEARRIDDLDRCRGYLYSGNFSVPTEVALAVGGFDEAFLDEGEEDLDFGARVMAALQSAVAVPAARAVHGDLMRTQAADIAATATPRRVGRADERLRQPGRGSIVNGGLAYWLGPRWQTFVVGGVATP